MTEKQERDPEAKTAVAAGRIKLRDRIRVLRATSIVIREIKAEGVVFGSKEDALAAVMERLRAPQGGTPVYDLVGDIDWDKLLEILEALLPLILALIQMFLL